jgi:hypothetical protein
MRPHVGAETMARYRQGDLNKRRSSHISTHLAGCERCSALSQDLGGVTTLLASSHPPPMADDLTARITGAIAAESASRAAAPAASQAPAAQPRRSPRRPRLPRITPKVALGGLAAAALVVVGGGIYGVVAHSGSTSPSASSAAPSAARPATRSPAGNGAMLPALPASGPALQYQRSGRKANITPITTSTNFTQAELASQATAQVKKYGAGFTKTGPNAESPSSSGSESPAAVPREQLGKFADIPVATLRGCVERIAAGSLVLLVDVARYSGSPATIIVTEAAETGPMRIWVVGTGCSASNSDVLQRAVASAP